jgi:hypothetical protein
VTQRLAYGTAGFRADARLLDAVFVKMGVLAALRSMQTGLVRSAPVERAGVAFAPRSRACPRRSLTRPPPRSPWASW